ncbi:MAG: trypsin-like peptidase domain-containing protein [Opitutae bacterium]|nr:trypsin-like peptidase domain-containing protein [Opitutae bacterium]
MQSLRLLASRLTFALALLTASHAGRAAETAAPTPPPAAPTAEPAANRIENAVVKIFATQRYPDLSKPWTKQAPRDVTGTGIVIEGKRILTNAHVVLYGSQVQVQANQSGDKLPAIIEAVAPGIDLALLKLEDESFFDTHPPLVRANTLPGVKDTVMAYGFPTGGTSLAITKGIVSRIEFASYNYSVSGLRIQIDAAINPGNSGGPALVGDKMIGLAYSRLGGAENIGYIIPCEEIELFLADLADGAYDGKPALYDELQTLENPALRAFLKLDKSVEGIVVRTPYDTDPAYPLQNWDVISKIGDTSIDNEGKIKLGDNLRVNFSYLIQKLARDGKVPLTIVRQSKAQTIQLPVTSARAKLLPYLKGAYPSYFVYGPLVFAPATDDFVSVFTGSGSGGISTLWSMAGSPLVLRRGDKPAFDGEELVIVPSPFFSHKLQKGYGTPMGRVVHTVNGIAIKNLRHLVTVLRDAKEEFITIQFVGRFAESLVFPRKDMVAATEDILNDNGVRSQGSPDTLSVWNEKPQPAR